MRTIIFILALLISLQGCFFAGAAAGAATVAVVYDHRKVEQVIQDQKIANGIEKQIKAIQTKEDISHIEITSFNNVVLLTGESVTPDLRDQVVDIAQNYPGVARVYNELAVRAPTSTLTEASDTWITTKIKTQMLATDGLKSGSIKVVTENGYVYLMGSVSHRQADIAVAIARGVSGVQRVVKVFQYTD